MILNQPRSLQRTRKEGFDHLVKTQPTAIVGDLIDTDTIVYENDKPTLGYFFVPDTLLQDIRKVVRGTKIHKSSRTDGLPTQSTIYGVLPRNNLRVDYCRFTPATKKEISFYRTMNNYCEVLCEYYEKFFPENYALAKNDVDSNIVGDWRHNKTPFQTININVNHAIKYHRDTGNFRSAMSTVLIVKNHMGGGELPVPEYDITLSQRDGAFTIFDGQSLLHGVLPIKPKRPDAYRASIVFYSMNALKNCYPYQAEIDRLGKRERDKSVTRYSKENKIALIEMNKRALEKINSPYLKWLEDPNAKIDGDRTEEGTATSEISGEAGDK